MSGNELQRIEILAEVLSGRRTEASAAKVKTNSEKGQYQKRGRQIYGPDYVPKIPAKAAAVAEPTAKNA